MAEDGGLAREVKALKHRLQVLEDKEAIRELLARYAFHADLNRLDDFVSLWTEDGTFVVGGEVGGAYKGREQIKQRMKGPQHQSVANHSQHLLVDLIINVDGDTATAAGYGLVTVHWQGGFGIWRGSFRTFRFRRVEGRWLIQEAVTHAAGDPQCASLFSPNL